jgi:hypothetical protein
MNFNIKFNINGIILKNNIFIILFFFLTLNSQAQTNEWSKIPAVEAYYTTLKLGRYTNSSGISPDEKYFLTSVNLSVSIPITEKIRLGTQFMPVSSKVIREPIDRAYLGSVFAQYNLRARKRLGIYFEGGYSLTNFCPCGHAETYSSDTINHFLQFGAGVSYKLTNRLHLKAGLINYSPFKGHSEAYNFTQPFIGLKYHFYKDYKTPFKSRFFKEVDNTVEPYTFFWEDDEIRKWNIGITSSGVTVTQYNPLYGQTAPLFIYREFSIVPRVNYWINQAILVGLQGTYYHYENNYDPIVQKNHGFGIGLQSRFYPLCFKNPDTFRAIRIGKKGNLNFSPIVGVEVHAANFSWLSPQEAGDKWQYVDFQPYAGFVLSYKDWFNLFWNIGPTLSVGELEGTSPVNGVRIIGLEYNFSKK